MTIYTDQIVASIGQLDPFIMKEVDNAIDFHLGRTSEVPKYLKDYEEELIGVDYNKIQTKDVKHEIISKDFIPAVNYKRQYRKQDDKPQMKKQKEKKNKKNEYTSIYKNKVTSIDKPTAIPLTNDDIVKWVNANHHEINYGEICRDRKMLIKYIDNESINMICSRIVPLALISEKYKISRRSATHMRITLTNMLIERGVDILSSSGNMHIASKIAESYLLGIILAKKFVNIESKNNISETYQDKINDMLIRYKINFNDNRIWKSSVIHYQ
jgi:hypothetical protein